MSENTNNQNINFSAKLSEMDKIFIPKDLDSNIGLEDVADYKVSIFRMVPENFRLVKFNIFTQKIRAAEGFGFKFVLPILTKTILVPAAILDGKQEYKNVDCLSNDKIEISVDLTIIMNITDPAKYKRKGTTQLSQLNSIIKRLLRIYVAKKKFDELVAEECNLAQFDQNEALRDFEDECGIRVNKVIFERVQLPEHLKKIYNDKAEEEQKRKAQKIRLQAEQEKAEAEAKIMNIQAQAEAEKIKIIESAKLDAYINKMTQFVDTLRAQGIPANEIAEQLKLEIASKNGNAIFMSGNNNSMGNDIASSVYAGNIASQNRQETKVKTDPSTGKVYTNSERLVQQMDAIALLNGNLSDTYQALRQELSTPGNQKKVHVDNLNEDAYQALVQNLQLQPSEQTTKGLKK